MRSLPVLFSPTELTAIVATTASVGASQIGWAIVCSHGYCLLLTTHCTDLQHYYILIEIKYSDHERKALGKENRHYLERAVCSARGRSKEEEMLLSELLKLHNSGEVNQ